MRNFIVNFQKCEILNGVKFLIYVCTIKIEKKKKISIFGMCRSLVFCSCVIKMPRCIKILDINIIKKKSGNQITKHLLQQLRYCESRVSALSFCHLLHILCPLDMVVHRKMLAASSI